ncbi:unnamed protein product [Clonostachys solani]|uniref:Zn(2)-C6 fungal-type domain-containing protein n=1 Tax=Clonostachys solani TaxID=160281 RepID=A0A9N9Z179_9HYPO|nr:unnamed protein product [Clonostachys solani]
MPNESASSIEPARTSTACKSCRSRKIKCSGHHPCRYCAKRQQECIFPDIERNKKKLFSVAYVEDLERRAASREPIAELRSDGGTTLEVEGETSSPQTQRSVLSQSQASSSFLIPEPVMSSSLRFGSRIKGLSKETLPLSHSQLYPHDKIAESPEDAYNLAQQSEWNQGGPSNFLWPSEETARSSLEIVLTSLGTVQHLVDPRAVSDHISIVYEQTPKQESVQSLWDIEVLLIIAIGELLQGKVSQHSVFPAIDCFHEAVRHIPGLPRLRRAGSIGVEIMGLAVFYLQCADCKDDAYVYAGLGLRLAISNGMARQDGSKRNSEAVHKNRLWWTIYMQERRLAAATGNPVGVSDDAITTITPWSSPGFQPVSALDVNIKLAKITGRINQEIYGRKSQSDREFIIQTQNILIALFQIQQEMPSQYVIDLTSDSSSFSRTSATLYLMLFQAVMLVTRPTLLHIARSRLGARSTTSQNENSPLDKFCRTCIEAAKKVLVIIDAAKQQNILAKFGFFDLDAIFSAAFVFVMAEVTEHKAPMGPSELQTAVSLLDHLGKCGNKASMNRLLDIRQMCSRLGIAIEISDTVMQISEESPAPIQNDSNQANQSAAQHDSGTSFTMMAPWSGLEGLVDGNFDVFSLNSTDIDSTTLGPWDDLILDGTVETDWEQFERATNSFS